MKNFFNLKEEIDTSLYEMEMLTHKKKIAAAQSVLDKAKAAHSKASDTHFKLSDAARKKHGKDSPQERAHVNMAKMHKRAGQGDFGGSHGAATVRHGDSYDFHGKHVPEKHVDHAEKLHNNMVDAHHKLQAAKKASPLHKAKTAVHKLAKKVGMKESKVDEISNDTMDRYYDKALKQFNVSRKRKDDPGYTPAKRAQHAARMKKRDKGLTSVKKRDIAPNPKSDLTRMFVHKPSTADRIRSNKGGMTNKPVPKTYKGRK